VNQIDNIMELADQYMGWGAASDRQALRAAIEAALKMEHLNYLGCMEDLKEAESGKLTSQDYFFRKSTVDWESEAGKQVMRAEEYKAEAEQLREQNTMLDIELAKDEALLRQALVALEVFERAGLSTLETVDAIKALRERLK
jgi:hypothetical protein